MTPGQNQSSTAMPNTLHDQGVANVLGRMVHSAPVEQGRLPLSAFVAFVVMSVAVVAAIAVLAAR